MEITTVYCWSCMLDITILWISLYYELITIMLKFPMNSDILTNRGLAFQMLYFSQKEIKRKLNRKHMFWFVLNFLFMISTTHVRCTHWKAYRFSYTTLISGKLWNRYRELLPSAKIDSYWHVDVKCVLWYDRSSEFLLYSCQFSLHRW